MDTKAREALVKQGEAMVYDDAPYAITYYYDDLEAYRSDRFTNFSPQPDPHGALVFQYGAYSYLSMEPVSDTSTTSSSKTGLWIGLGVGLVLVVGLGILISTRSRRTADDRE